MEIKIDSKFNNSLLNRTEVNFTIKHIGEATPNREIIRSELAEKLNTKKENIIIKKIKSSFGHNVISGYAKIYNTTEKSKEVEPYYILVRNKIIDKAKKEGVSASSKKEKTITEKTSNEKTIEMKNEATIEAKDESKDKKQEIEKKTSDKPTVNEKEETHTKKLISDQKIKESKKEG